MKRELVLIVMMAVMTAGEMHAAFVLQETFDSVTSGVPAGWSNYGGTTPGAYTWLSDSHGYSGRGMKYNARSAASNTTGWMQTPAMTLAGEYILRFRYQNHNAGDLNVYLSTDGGVTLGTKILNCLTTATDDEWGEAEYIINITTQTQNCKIVFVGTSNYGFNCQYIDDVEIETYPTCRAPEGIYASNLTATSADIYWDVAMLGYDYPTFLQMTVRDAGGNTIYSNNQIPNTTPFVRLSNLQSRQRYTVQMRGDCDSEDPATGISSYSGYSKYATYTFMTTCNPRAVPYTETFDNLTQLDQCMDGGNASITTTAAYSGSRSLQLTATASDVAYLMFPLLNVRSDSAEVSFKVRTQTATQYGRFMVGLVSDAGSPLGSFEPLFYDSVMTTEWVEIRMNTLQAYTQMNQAYVMIVATSGTSQTLYIDDVRIDYASSCIRPEQLKISDIHQTSATLTWTMSNAPQHIIYITNANGTTTETCTGSPHTVIGLQPDMDYSFAVRAICSASDSSETSIAATCHTICTPLSVATWSEGAESTTGQDIPTCWQRGFYALPTNPRRTYLGFVGSQMQYHTGRRCLEFQAMEAGGRAYLSSRAFHIDQPYRYEVSLWTYRVTIHNTEGEGIGIWISDSPSDTTGAEFLGFINRAAEYSPIETGSAGWYQYSYPITKTGDVFLLIEGRSHGGGQILIDDIRVDTAATCRHVTDIMLGIPTGSSNTISWTPSPSGESQWVVEYELRQGYTTVRRDTVTVSQPRYTIGNLTSNTSYTVVAKVYAKCSATELSEEMNHTGTFTTQCGMGITFPYMEDFEGVTVGTTPTCWSTAASTTRGAAQYLWAAYMHEGNQSLRMCNAFLYTGEAIVDMPAITLPASAMTLSFIYSNRANCGDLDVQISNDGGVTFSTLSSWGTTGTNDYDDPGDFANASVSLAAYTGQSVIIRFHASANWGYGAIFIDNVEIRRQTTCADLQFGITEVTGTSAVIAIGSSQPIDWEISIGDNPGDSTIAVSQAVIDTLTGLTPQTTYTVRVRRSCSNDYGEWSIARTFTTTKPCPDITATVSQVLDSTVLVTLSKATAKWQIDLGNGVTVNATGASHLIAGLTPQTAYSIRVRTDCDSMYGDWSQPYSFTTTATPDYVPYYNGFEDTQENAKWVIVNGSGTNYWTIGTAATAVAAGSKALYVSSNGQYGYNDNSATKTYAYRTLGFKSRTYTLSFKWKCEGGEWSHDFGRVMLVPAYETITGGAGTSYSSTVFPNYVEAFDPSDQGYICLTEGDASGWNSYQTTLDMTSRPGQYKFVVMWNNDQYSSYGAGPLAIDEISIEEAACAVPNIVTSATTAYGTTVSVNATSGPEWHIVVSSTPIDPLSTVTGDILDTITTSTDITVAGLTPSTTYYCTAQGRCAPGKTSAWADPIDFRTNCAPFAIPYSEGFEDYAIMECWSSIGSRYAGVNGYRKYSGNMSCHFEDCLLISPELDILSTDSLMISGYVTADEDSTVFTIGVMSDPAAVESFDPIETVVVPTAGQWVDFSVIVGNTRYVALVATQDASVYIDDIVIGSQPSCVKPSDGTVYNITPTTAVADWTDHAGASQWVITTTSLEDGSTRREVATAHPWMIRGLTPATPYYVNVAALCSATDTSYNCYCGAIQTLCATHSVPWMEDFERYTYNTVPSCWDTSTSTARTGNSFVTMWGIIQEGSGNKSVRMSNYDTQAGTAALMSPQVTLPADNPCVLRFRYCHQSNAINGDLKVKARTLGGNWNTLGRYQQRSPATTTTATSEPANYVDATVSLTGYEGETIEIMFEAEADRENGAIFIDDVSVDVMQSCRDLNSIAATNVTDTSATIRLVDPTASHTQWEYVYGESGFSITTATIHRVSVDSFPISGLQASTTYDIYVRAVCSATEQSNWILVTFKTRSAASARCGIITDFPYEQNFDSLGTQYDHPDMIENICWSQIGAGASYPRYLASGTTKTVQMQAGNGESIIFILPEFTTPGSKHLSFDYRADYANSTCGIVKYGYITNPAMSSTFVPMGSTVKSQTVATYNVDYGTLPAGSRIALQYTNASSHFSSAYIDNVRITELIDGDVYSDTICHGEPYTGHGFNVSAAELTVGDNVKSRFNRSATGMDADTVVTANIYVRAEMDIVIYDTACAWQTYVNGDFVIPNPRTRSYNRTFTSTTGCDSTVTLRLYVAPSQRVLFDTICEGETYTLGKHQLRASGTYTDYSVTAKGCADTTTLHLTVVPASSTINEIICAGNTYSWHGQNLKAAGTYTWSGTGMAGCDVTETLNLTVAGGDTAYGVALCQGSQYLFGDTLITTAGTYTRTYYDAMTGCIRRVTLTATMTSTKEEDINDYVCEGHLYSGYGIKNLAVTADTTIDINTRTEDALCDSTAHIHISLVNTVYTDEYETIANGDPVEWNGATYSKPGDYTAKLWSLVTGCDSIVTLHLTEVWTGVENVAADGIYIVPNPVKTGEPFHISGNVSEVARVEVVDQMGHVVSVGSIEVGGIGVSGVYHVRVTMRDGRVVVRKVVVD